MIVRLLISLWLIAVTSGLAAAADSGAAQEAVTRKSSRMPTWLAPDITRYSLGFSSTEINNPAGFDLPSSTYVNGKENEGFIDGRLTLNISLEQGIASEGKIKRLWTLQTDNEQFNGLDLFSIVVGPGVAVSPQRNTDIGLRLAAGTGVGITRSQSFFDSTLHPAAELWVSAGVQVGPFVVDIGYRTRKALGRTLDKRRASPSTLIRSLTLGWLF